MNRQDAPYEPAATLPAHLAHAARCDACEAVLIVGFDPTGDRCRNCPPKEAT